MDDDPGDWGRDRRKPPLIDDDDSSNEPLLPDDPDDPDSGDDYEPIVIKPIPDPEPQPISGGGGYGDDAPWWTDIKIPGVAGRSQDPNPRPAFERELDELGQLRDSLIRERELLEERIDQLRGEGSELERLLKQSPQWGVLYYPDWKDRGMPGPYKIAKSTFVPNGATLYRKIGDTVKAWQSNKVGDKYVLNMYTYGKMTEIMRERADMISRLEGQLEEIESRINQVEADILRVTTEMKEWDASHPQVADPEPSSSEDSDTGSDDDQTEEIAPEGSGPGFGDPVETGAGRGNHDDDDDDHDSYTRLY